jgi:hypothetical protein
MFMRSVGAEDSTVVVIAMEDMLAREDTSVEGLLTALLKLHMTFFSSVE